ncbi:MAG: hypothetical protein CMO55_06125 [Verrucomicrobiales bacterium]|nr:hypothetical protein [Verrucomicrobiales bacterium]
MESSGKQKKISIHVALSTVGVFLILFTSVSIGLVSYFSTQRVVNTLSDEVFSAAYRETTLTVRAKLDQVNAVLSSNRELVAQEFVGREDIDALAKHFVRVLEANEYLSETGYGDREGRAVWAERDPPGKITVFKIEQQADGRAIEKVLVPEGNALKLVSEGPSDYDPRERPWYQSAAASEVAVWTDPYIFANGYPGLSRSSRLLDESGDVVGVFDASFELDFLSQFLNANKREEFGQLFVVNFHRGGEVIAHPDSEKMVNRSGDNPAVRTVKDIDDPRLEAAYEIVENTYQSHTGADKLRQRFEFEGTNFILLADAFDLSPELSWYALYLIPEEEIMGPVHRANRVALIVSLIATFLGIVIAFAISKRMSHRLNVLSEDIGGIGQLIISDRKPKGSVIREIDVLETSVDVMKKGLLSFQKFVPTELVRSLLENGAEAKLEGRRQELTIFFSDIIGYSTICEKLGPEELVEELGVYLEEMTNTLERNRGTVNQYVGDAIMAIFGAPDPVKEHALCACRGALEFQKRNEELALQAEEEGRVVFRSRIGINTGEVIVGNLGSSNRLYYTANGDEVNLAARLESINSIYGTRIVVGESTRIMVKEEMVCRLLDYVAVKGKVSGAAIHELVGEKGDVSEDTLHLIETYEAGMNQYLQREWDEAVRLFEDCLDLCEDTAAQVLRDRCLQYRESPPPEEWSGVFEMTQK